MYLCNVMKVLIAPDSYKGCLSAQGVAAALADGVRAAWPEAEIAELPLADGGEGTAEVLTRALGGVFRTATVSDPLGRPVRARYGIAGDTALIEVAAACGLPLLSPEERHPLETTTRGVGELLLAAREAGCTRFLIGLGGSATCDGGTGMLSVTGLREALHGCDLEILCDVDNPLLGPNGAARVFAPQKGATPAEVEVLEERLAAFAARTAAETGIPVADLPGAGAAGGLGAAFLAWLGARQTGGIGRVLELTGFRKQAAGTDLILTGEGKSDRQTLSGKVPLGVLHAAGDIPVWLVSGAIEDAGALKKAGFARLLAVTPTDMSLSEALRPETASRLLRNAISTTLLPGPASQSAG